MNKLFWGLALIVISFSAKSQDNNLTIIASGSGNSENTAINSALRNAIEKTFGVFISSSTTIQNDNLVSDDIASVSSGNIVSYQIIDQKTDGVIFQVTLSASLSPQKIVQSYKEKGHKEFELNGNVYQQNILKEKFYKEQEPIIVEEFFKKYELVRLFDKYEIKICEPFRYSPKEEGLGFWEYGEFLNRKNLLCEFDFLGCTLDKRWTEFYNNTNSEFKINTSNLLRIDREFGKQNFPHYIIPIKYTPIFNSITADELSKSLISFFENMSIKDISDYQNKYGNPIKISCIYPINERGKSKITRIDYYLRSSKSIEVINKYMEYFERGSDVNSIYFENFKPTLYSKIIKSKYQASTCLDKKEGIYSLIDDFRRVDGNSEILYRPSHLILEVSENELGQIINLKVLRDLENLTNEVISNKKLNISSELVIPKSFSPNGDNIDDTWVIPNIQKYPDVAIKIYNRYGIMIFSSTGYNTPWDGKNKGIIVPSGEYYWIIDNFGDNKTQLKGTISVLR